MNDEKPNAIDDILTLLRGGPDALAVAHRITAETAVREELHQAVATLMRIRPHAAMLCRAAKMPALDASRWRDLRDRPDYPQVGNWESIVRSAAAIIEALNPQAIPMILDTAKKVAR